MQCQVGLIQMAVTEDKRANLQKAREEIAKAAEMGAELVILPEMFATPYDTKRFPAYAESEDGESQQMLAEMAKTKGIYLVGGSICELDEDGHYYNTSYVYDPNGRLLAKHRKAHLFDIDIKGGQYFKESDVLSAGDGITLFDTPWGRVGLAICFDLRFAEMAHAMVEKGAQILIYPAAFNRTTGPRHWELLFRARAVDGQCYAIGVSTAPQPQASYVSWGHSLVVNPWGEVLLDCGVDETTKVVTLDMEEVTAVRQQIPLRRS